jgi:hypothetical protein
VNIAKFTFATAEKVMDVYKIITFFGLDGTILAAALISAFAKPALLNVFSDLTTLFTKSYTFGSQFFYTSLKVIHVSLCGIFRLAMAPFVVIGTLFPKERRDKLWTYMTSRFKSSIRVIKYRADPDAQDGKQFNLEAVRQEAQDIFGPKNVVSKAAKQEPRRLLSKRGSIKRRSMKRNILSLKNKKTIGRIRSIQARREKTSRVRGGYNFGHAAIGFGIAKIAGQDTKKSLAIGGLSGFI